jgi:hypothetical protein
MERQLNAFIRARLLSREAGPSYVGTPREGSVKSRNTENDCGGGEMEKRISEAREELRARARDNRISCTEAREIAAEFDIPVRAVGDLANELKIKIYACELGCF